jgi:hypothetical protein
MREYRLSYPVTTPPHLYIYTREEMIPLLQFSTPTNPVSIPTDVRIDIPDSVETPQADASQTCSNLCWTYAKAVYDERYTVAIAFSVFWTIATHLVRIYVDVDKGRTMEYSGLAFQIPIAGIALKKVIANEYL